MKLKPLILIIASVCFVHSCIDPVDFSKGDDSKSLVVDGLITNAPGPYVVKLERTSDYNITSEHTEEVQGAVVFLSDDVGNSETLTESHMPGTYETDPGSIRGVPGRYYKIEIVTPDGKHYESDYELLSPVPEIDAIYYERQQLQELDDDNNVRTFEGFQIYIDTRDPENSNNYYMWSWDGTHEVHIQPWDYDMWGTRYAPKDCCATCWVTELPGHINVLDDRLFAGNQMNKMPVVFVRIKKSDGARFFRGKFHVEVKQLSLSKEAYKYWFSIKEQIRSSGSIFEPPHGAIMGNIENINDPEDIVFGYFGASAISTNSIFIPASEAPYHPDDTLVWPDDCRRFPNSTTIEPSFW